MCTLMASRETGGGGFEHWGRGAPGLSDVIEMYLHLTRHMYRLLFDDTCRATLVNESWNRFLPKSLGGCPFWSARRCTTCSYCLVCLAGVRSGNAM